MVVVKLSTIKALPLSKNGQGYTKKLHNFNLAFKMFSISRRHFNPLRVIITST